MPKDVPRNLKPYYLGLLIKGTRWNDVEGSEDLAARQLAFIRQQAESGHYRMAGPIVDGGDIVGMMIVEAGSAEEALAIARQDPAVLAERISVEIRSAFLPSLDPVRVLY